MHSRRSVQVPIRNRTAQKPAHDLLALEVLSLALDLDFAFALNLVGQIEWKELYSKFVHARAIL